MSEASSYCYALLACHAAVGNCGRFVRGVIDEVRSNTEARTRSDALVPPRASFFLIPKQPEAEEALQWIDEHGLAHLHALVHLCSVD